MTQGASQKRRRGAPRVSVIGIGNVLARDEGIGPKTVEALLQHDLPENIRIVNLGGAGISLLDYFEDSDAVIIVDCAMMGLEPGAIRVFGPSEVKSRRGHEADLSLHSGDVLGLIELGSRVGPVPPIRIVGVQPQVVDSGMGLSSTLERRLPDVVQAVLAEIERICG